MTAAGIIAGALRKLGQIAAGTDPTTDEYADGLTALNALLDSWRNERLMCYATQTESLTLSASTSSYAIGPGGTLNTTRPVEIEAAWILDGGSSYAVRIITDGEYDAIPTKLATADWPSQANYRPTMSTGTLYVYPVPNATATLKLRTRVVFAAFATTADTVTAPPGWERALTYGLAVELAPEFEMEPSSTVLGIARASKAAIKRVNTPKQRANTGLVNLFGGGRSRIDTNE